MDLAFLADDALRAHILRESGSAAQQMTLLNMYRHRQQHGVPGRQHTGGGRRPRGVNIIRVEMLKDQIVSITLSPGVLSFTKAQGERLTSGPVITSGTITEFRCVFVYGLNRTCDPSLSIITSPDGSKCEVIFRCRRVLCEVLGITPDQLERWCNIAYPPEDEQPRVVLTCGPGAD